MNSKNKILTKAYAMRLVRSGKARIDGDLKRNERGVVYTVITRFDNQSTCHFDSGK